MSVAPAFQYEIRLCDSFEGVLDQVGTSVAVDRLPALALDTGRLLIQAPGGAGKTTTLGRAEAAAAAAGLRTVNVWAVDWVATAAAERAEVDVGALDEALGAVSDPRISSKVFADGIRTVLFVDGLNELQRQYADVLLDAVDRLAARYPQLGVIVADRLARRSVSDSWQLATLSPVPEWQIRDLVGVELPEMQIALLGSPFFLERARQNPLSAETHHAFFASQLGLSSAEMLTLAAAVNAQYWVRADRLMQTPSLVQAVGGDVIERLVTAGVILVRGEESIFSHHLLSDFLAALHLADKPERWSPNDFDALTFRASSFDALAILLEEVSAADVDTLVRRVYDWNLYGAAYLLAQDWSAGRRISKDIQTVLIALLAERQFDRLLASARQARDALRLQKSEVAESLRSASDASAVLATVAALPVGSEWFERWRALFLGGRDGSRSTVLQALQSIDGILGWTAANVLKRRPLDETETAHAVSLLKEGKPPVRWRAAHVLGKSQDREAVDCLLKAIINDEYLWVPYGAVRSLIEIASSSDRRQDREYIFLGLASLAGDIGSKPDLAREVERSLKVEGPPQTWPEDAGLLLERLWAVADSVDEQDRWRRISADLRGVAA